MKAAAMWILRVCIEAYWLLMLAVAFLVIGALFVLALPFLEAPVQTTAKRRGLAPRALPRWVSETDFCGCCGRHAVVGQLWCFDCAFHIDENAQQPHDRTYYAQHSEICPFTDADEESAEPWAQQRDFGDENDYDKDIVAEGLGPAHPQGHHVTPLEQLTKGERSLWDEVRRGIA